MTRVEMREARQKQFRKGMLFLFACCLLSFLLGILTYHFVCRSSNEEVLKVEHSGSVTVYVVSEDVEEVEEEPTVYPEVEDVEEAEPEPEQEEFVSYYPYTEEELDLLARLIYSEGGIESYETKLKIGSVVMNRVSEDTYFPDTIREVIYQKNQFSVTTVKMDGVVMIDRPADEESLRAAKEILDYGSVLPPDVQVFYADGLCEGNWVTTREVYEVSDRTVFAYIYPQGE